MEKKQQVFPSSFLELWGWAKSEWGIRDASRHHLFLSSSWMNGIEGRRKIYIFTLADCDMFVRLGSVGVERYPRLNLCLSATWECCSSFHLEFLSSSENQASFYIIVWKYEKTVSRVGHSGISEAWKWYKEHQWHSEAISLLPFCLLFLTFSLLSVILMRNFVSDQNRSIRQRFIELPWNVVY